MSLIDTTTANAPVEINNQDQGEDEIEEEDVNGGEIRQNSSTWKQEVVAQNPLMGKLLQPEFDQAAFLYNMYKSCTVGEIEDFKISLSEIRDGTVVGAS